MTPCRWWMLLVLLSCLSGTRVDARADPVVLAEGHRRWPLTVQGGTAGFDRISPAPAGITFTNLLDEERSLTNQIFLNGSGVAAGDVDGDGRCDLYFCGLDSPNALYRNLGDWRFADITATAGVACADQASTGAVLVDVEGDGDLDLLVAGIARGVRLFLNSGTGVFAEATEAQGLRTTLGSTTLALGDVDGDGWLDLYVVNYRSDTMRDLPDMRFRVGTTNGVSRLLSVNGRPATDPALVGRFSLDQNSGVLENGEADRLWLNREGRRFEAVDWEGGRFRDENGAAVSTPYDWGLSALLRDFTGDGAPDLYVCNDFQSPDRFWINDGRGQFRAAPARALGHTSLFSMGVDVADLDRDGRDDFFVADMLSREHERRMVQVMDAAAFAQFRATPGRPQVPRNTLFWNRGDGTYAEIAPFAGLDASEWTWCPVFLDVDLDGFEDLLVTTGHWRDAQHADISREIEEQRQRQRLSHRDQLRLRRRFPRLDTPNLAFRNRGDLTFAEVSAAWGFDARPVSHGLALADLDDDGDLDAVVNCLNEGPLLLRNRAEAPRIAVRLRGRAPNTGGVGARITVRVEGEPAQSQEMLSGGRYVAGDQMLRTFAALRPESVATVEVRWRSGARTVLAGVPANSLVEIAEDAASPPRTAPPAPGPEAQPWFADASALLAHVHVDEPHDDFALQPLLPHRWSEPGPGVSWFDFNHDGWDDLLVTGGRGGRLSVFRNDARGGFVRQRSALFEAAATEDLTMVLGWRSAPTVSGLLLGFSGHGSPLPAEGWAPLRSLSLATGTLSEPLARSPVSTGPLAMADVDRDGDLDVFVGGRGRTGRYPEAVDSSVLLRDGERWVGSPEWEAALKSVGLVVGAVFTDLDQDGGADLVLAREWGSILVLRNRLGRPEPWDPGLTGAVGARGRMKPKALSELTGWWTSVAAGDFDGDGRMDLLAGNWGRNTSREAFLEAPLVGRYGDADGTGHLAFLELHFDPALRRLVPSRDWGTLSAAFPVLRSEFPGYAAFARADGAQVTAVALPQAAEVRAATLDSVLLLNRGESFEVRPLPRVVQWSPAFGIAVGDFNGDGHEDAVVVQNFHGVPPSEARLDAGAGVVLRGDGRGGFESVPPGESGLRVEGQGRGVAVADYDRDGRLDVVVGQLRGPTLLYRNQLGTPGVRVRLVGPEGNAHGLGARLRATSTGRAAGPWKEVRGGSGYRSQDSSVVVVHTQPAPDRIEVIWPDGHRQEVTVPAGATEVECRHR